MRSELCYDRAMARVCKASYRTKSGSVGDLEYLFDKIGGHPVIALRGTEFSDIIGGSGWIDVVRDVRIVPWYDRRVGWAHAGMLKGAKAVFEELTREITFGSGDGGVYFHGSPVVTVTGHSLGGGVGLLLAHMLDHLGLAVCFVGFGTPRCMISKPRDSIVARYYRNGDDVVTQLPRWWMGGYRENPVRQIGDDTGLELLSDHHIDEYIDSLICV